MKMAVKTSWHKPPLWLRIYIEALFWFKGLKATKMRRMVAGKLRTKAMYLVYTSG